MAQSIPFHTKGLFIIAVICVGCLISAMSLKAVPIDQEPRRQATTTTQPKTLTNTSWVWKQTTLADGTVTTPVNSALFVANFDGTQVSSSTDCNGISGPYVISGESITFGNFTTTLMFCEGSIEATYSQSLQRAVSYSISGSTLTLRDKDANEMIFTARSRK